MIHSYSTTPPLPLLLERHFGILTNLRFFVTHNCFLSFCLLCFAHLFRRQQILGPGPCTFFIYCAFVLCSSRPYLCYFAPKNKRKERRK
ncbi:MAG: hypothetical protein J3R72DRAFT_445809 [Linnemannia gamsii]|nr:MAG: hypothetical protein J3R72DRAFT_445809 [Linnemannia gamsii]